MSLRLDSHGGEREREDEALAVDLDARLREALLGVIRDPKYSRILLFEPEWYESG